MKNFVYAGTVALALILGGCKGSTLGTFTPEQIVLGATCAAEAASLGKDVRTQVEQCQALGRLVTRASTVTITEEQRLAANACIGESVVLVSGARDRIASCEKLANLLLKAAKTK